MKPLASSRFLSVGSMRSSTANSSSYDWYIIGTVKTSNPSSSSASPRTVSAAAWSCPMRILRTMSGSSPATPPG